MSDTPSIVWFRNDLRFSDNAALAAAIDTGAPVIPIYVWDECAYGDRVPGSASRWWLHEALKQFAIEWEHRGGVLILRQGDSLEVIRALVRETGAARVFWNRRYESPLRELDVGVRRALYTDGLEIKTYNSALLNEPHEVSTKAGQPYKVFTPYFKAVKSRAVREPLEPQLDALRFPEALPQPEPLEDFGLVPDQQLHRGFKSRWDPSEAGAKAQLECFLDEAVSVYDVERDRPDHAGTSNLSPYLHFGQLGPRQVIAALRDCSNRRSEGADVFFREVYWREFAHHVLYHFPETPNAPLRPQYESFPWQQNMFFLSRWQQGLTGYPIVDAGLRELQQTGWMHNRVRMIVASLLVKHLLQDWKAGAAWFWEHLVDADLANNTLGWQWSAGCGADAAPYFRVFNPILQGKKFDPEGDYVRRYVPELARLPTRHIHTPWEAPDSLLISAGVSLGESYPEPIIEHALGRARALEAFAQFRRNDVAATVAV